MSFTWTTTQTSDGDPHEQGYAYLVHVDIGGRFLIQAAGTTSLSTTEANAAVQAFVDYINNNTAGTVDYIERMDTSVTVLYP